MKVTYNLFADSDFNTGFKKIANHSAFKNFKTIYNVAKIVKGFNEELKTFNDVRNKVVEKNGEHDKEKGSYFIKEENREAYNKEMNQLYSTEFTIECPKIYGDELVGVNLTPNEIVALDPILILKED